MNDYIIFYNDNGICELRKFQSEKDNQQVIEYLCSEGVRNFFLTQENIIPTYIYYVKNKDKQIYFKTSQGLLYLHDKDKKLYDYFKTFEGNINLFLFRWDYVNDFNYETKDFNKLIINKYKYKLDSNDFKYANLLDFTKNKKYFGDICHILVKLLENDSQEYGNLFEDIDKNKKILYDFDNPKIKSIIKKNGQSLELKSYNSFSHLFEVLDLFWYSKQDDYASNINEVIEKTLIFEDDMWYVCIPKSHNQSKILGKSCNWCTAADSAQSERIFQHYNDDSPLIVFINKDDLSKKYQYHWDSKQFMDKYDKPINHINQHFGYEFIYNYINSQDLKDKTIPREFFETLFKDYSENNSQILLNDLYKKYGNTFWYYFENRYIFNFDINISKPTYFDNKIIGIFCEYFLNKNLIDEIKINNYIDKDYQTALLIFNIQKLILNYLLDSYDLKSSSSWVNKYIIIKLISEGYTVFENINDFCIFINMNSEHFNQISYEFEDIETILITFKL